MVNKEILDFIQKQIAAGVSKDQVTTALASGGWSAADVEEAYAAIHAQPLPTQPMSEPVLPVVVPPGFVPPHEAPPQPPTPPTV